MTCQLKSRNLLTLLDFSSEEIQYLLDLAKKLKQAKQTHTEKKQLIGKNIALIFEKTSTRTRCAFEVAAFDQGANVTFISSGSQMGHKESVKDTARVLGRYYDGIEFRGFSHNAVEILGKYSGVPVWNGLTDTFHPTQLLADLMTMQEHCQDKPLSAMKLCYAGDGRNNMGNSMLVACSKMGVNLAIAAPSGYHPEEHLIDQCQKFADVSGATLEFPTNIAEGVKGADFVYGDVWVSMGEPEEQWDKRIQLMLPFRITNEIMKASQNEHVKYMHCLPAIHNKETTIGKKLSDTYNLDGIEVSEEVFESDYCIAFDQAENRMHSIKAVLIATLVDPI